MSRTIHTCDGCYARLEWKDDLEKVQGEVYPTWRCRYCKTTVPAEIAERIKHQER